MKRRVRALGLVLLLALTDLAGADLTTGRDKLAAGDYKTAIAELSKVSGKDRSTARVMLARAQMATGDYAAAEQTLAPLATGKDPAAVEARIARADLRKMTGKLGEARRDLEALFKDRPDDRAVRTELGKLRALQGDNLGAKALFDKTIAESDANKLDLDNAIDMIQLAEAAKHTGQYKLANDAYREAVKLDPRQTDAGVAWADLFLQKYAAQLAEQTLEDVFKINPNHPDGHAAMAEVIMETRYDLAAVKHHLDKVFEINPKNARGLKVRAAIEIDGNQWDAAHKTLDQVLAINKEDVEALSMKATIAWLRDDVKLYQAEKDKVFAINPKYADLYRIVSRSAVREHRYVEAIELEKEAVKIKPDYYEAMAGAGLGYLRLGMEKEGIEWLDKSWAGDQYNVRTYNTRNLFRNTIPKEYQVANTKNFRIRYHNEDRAVFARYLEPTMERAFEDMVKRYGFRPKTPITLELYADRNDYGIRTVGLPDLGALGVCFGLVITALAPSTGDLNWGMVMWHELGHVFAIQLSNSRVPRWFTEGLSEYETLIAHPHWRRENDNDLYGAMLNGTLPSIGALNSEFMQPDQNAVVVAYYQSAVTMEWLIQTFGFKIVPEALKLFGKGKETPEVLKTVTGKTIAQLDTEFRKYLEIRLKPYAGTYKLPTKGFDDVTKLEIAADAAPKDGKARANVALGHYYAGEAEKAQSNANAALALDPKQPIARFILAEIAVHKNDAAKAKQMYTALAADGFDNADLRARLAQIAENEGNAADLEKHLCAAKKLDPERSFAYQELAELYEKKGDTKRALQELEHYAMLEQMELAPLKKLMTEYAKQKNWPKVRTYGELAIYIAPHDPEVLNHLGRAQVETGAGDKGLFSYDTMLLTNPRRPGLVHLGRARALLAMGKKAEAKTALTEALKKEPDNAEALELKKQLP